MVYAYIRISTDKQTLENQRYELLDYAQKEGLVINEWMQEEISSRKEERLIFELIDKIKKDDILIVSELSRIGRSMIEVNKLVSDLLLKKAKLLIVKNNIKVNGSIESQALIFAIGIASQIERDLISERTKNALAMRKAKGMKLGRKTGTGLKLENKESEIKELLEKGLNTSNIAKYFKVNRLTMVKFIKDKRLK